MPEPTVHPTPRSRPLSGPALAPTAPPRPAGGGQRHVGALVLALAFALRLLDATRASFHLDDFHTLHHARAASLRAFYDLLVQDNHPPLSFLVLRSLRAAFGEHELLLRLPNVCYGTLTVFLVWRLGRFLPGTAARLLATLLAAGSSLQLDLSSDLRMYALLGLCVLGWIDAFVDVARGERGALRLSLWTAAALLTHYHALHAFFVLGLAGSGLVLARVVPRARVRLLVGAGLAGLLLALPWYLTGFRAQLGHELAPGGSRVSAALLGESFVHLVFVRFELLPGSRPLLLTAGVLLLPMALLGAWRLARRARGPERVLPALLCAAALLLPAWTALAAWLAPRAGFEWRYLAAAIGPYALLAGAFAAPGRWERARVGLLSACAAAAAALSIAHVVDPGREDYAGAARTVLAETRPGDAVLAVEWQPRLFPHGGGWRTYARMYRAQGLAQGVESRELEHTAEFELVAGTELGELERVFCVLRSVPDGVPLLARLREEFPREEKRAFGEGLWLLVFGR